MEMVEKLELLMKKKGINRSEFSKQADIPYMTIVNFYEKGTQNVKLSTLKKIADFFGCSIDYLADDDVKEFQPKLQERLSCSINCTPKEKRIIEAYREKPEVQIAVDRLLGIEECSEEFLPKEA